MISLKRNIAALRNDLCPCCGQVVDRRGDVTLDAARFSITRDGVTVQLTPLRFRIVNALLKKPLRARSRRSLADEIYESHDMDVELDRIKVELYFVRRNLRPLGIEIIAGRGRGSSGYEVLFR